MGDPAYNLDDDTDLGVTPDFPGLRSIDGDGEGDGVPEGDLSSVKNPPEDEGSAPAEGAEQSALGKLRLLNGGGGDSESLSDTLGKGFTSLSAKGGASGLLGKTGKKFLDMSNRRKAGVGGAVAGGGVTIALVAAVIGGGPLEFAHISQLLHDAHFSQQENAGDSRMGRLLRFTRSGGRAGETRLNSLESHYHAKIVGELEDIGIKPVYGAGDIYNGVEIDLTHENSPYKGMPPEEAAAAFEQRTGIKPTIEEGKLTISADKYLSQTKSLKAVLGELDAKGVTVAVRTHVLGKFGLVTWRPEKVADKALAKKGYAAWKKAQDDRVKNKAQNKVDSSKAARDDGKTTPDGKPVAPTDISTEPFIAEPAASTNTLKAFAGTKTFKATGGVAAVVGLLCIAKGVDDHVAVVRYAQDIQPLERLGMNAMAAGYQLIGTGLDHAVGGSSDAAAGTAIDTTVLGFLSKSLHDPGVKATATTKGTPPTSWNQAEGFAARSGDSNGIPLDSQTKELLTQDKPEWLDWTQRAPVTQLCGTAGSIITGGVSVVVGVISGGAVSTAAQLVAGFAFTPLLLDKLGDLVSGNAINLAKQGAQWGNQVDYGTMFGANSGAAAMGGVAMTPAQAVVVNNQAAQQQNAEFASKSLFDKVFDAKDYHSAAGHAIDSAPDLSNTASIIGSLTHVFSSLIRVPATLIAGKAGAAPKPVDYGIPQYGFSQDDLNNPLVADPYANADAVGALLDAAPSPPQAGNASAQTSAPAAPQPGDYIKKANDCFGVKLTKGADGWDAIPDHDVDMYNDDYAKLNCADHSDTNWTRVRFFIMDTGVMEGYTCYKFDDSQSCGNSGMGGDTNGSTATSTAGAAITGDIGKNSDTVDCAANTKDLGVATSQYAGSVKKESGSLMIRLCQLSSISGAGQDPNGTRISGGAVVNSRVSGAWEALGEKAKSQGVPLAANSSFRLGDSCGGNGDGRRCAKANGSMHQLGIAIDFAGPTAINEDDQSCANRQKNPGNPTWDWLEQNAAAFGFKQYSAEAWHWDALPAANRCGGDGS